MGSNIVNIILLLFASLLTALLVHFKISINTFQQLIGFLIIILLIIINKFLKPSKESGKKTSIFRNLILLLSSLLVQFLVISSGGFFSPFLILIHLFAIAASFLISLSVALFFIVFALSVLALSIWLNPIHLELIKNDPGTLLLYITSFLVIVPLSRFISSKYHIKEELSNLLSSQVQIQDTIIQNLSELIFVTDPQLKIISINNAARNLLKLSDDILGKNLFEILNLRNLENLRIKVQDLPIQAVTTDKTTRIVSGLLLYMNNRPAPFNISLQIRPIIDATFKVSEFSIILTEDLSFKEKNHNAHIDLEPALIKQDKNFTKIEEELTKANLPKIEAETLLLKKSEQDIFIAAEIEDHAIAENPELLDVAELVNTVVLNKRELAKNLGIDIQLNLPIEETTLISLKKSDTPKEAISISDFTIPFDKRWVGILFEKLIDIGLLLSANNNESNIEVSLTKREGALEIKILFISATNIDKQKHLLFIQYYGELNKLTNLSLGSGLEGFIAKSISQQLNIPIIINTLSTNQSVGILINLSTIPRQKNTRF